MKARLIVEFEEKLLERWLHDGWNDDEATDHVLQAVRNAAKVRVAESRANLPA